MEGEISPGQDQDQSFFIWFKLQWFHCPKLKLKKSWRPSLPIQTSSICWHNPRKSSKVSTSRNPLKGSSTVCRMVMNKWWSHSSSGKKLWKNTTIVLLLDIWVWIRLWVTLNEHSGGKAYGEISDNTCDSVWSVNLWNQATGRRRVYYIQSPCQKGNGSRSRLTWSQICQS